MQTFYYTYQALYTERAEWSLRNSGQVPIMDLSEKTDEEIVKLSLTEREFFGELIERYKDKLSRYVTRLGVRNKEDREDVLQEIFIKVYKNLNGFDTSLSFNSWIYRIAHNEAISWYRKQQVRPEGHLVSDAEPIFSILPQQAPNAEQLFDESLNADRIAEALRDLDEKYRSVLILRFFEHKEYEEISDILKIPTGTVGTLVHRGKKALKDIIDTQKICV